MTSETHRVFVYGTLLSGEPNNALLVGSKLIGPAITVEPEFRMFSAGFFPYVALDNKGLGYKIHGEVWEINGSTLARLDRLEGVPYHYQRILIETAPAGQAFIYISPSDANLLGQSLKELADGKWKR